MKNRWLANYSRELVIMIPALLIYLHNDDVLTVEERLRRNEEEVNLDVTTALLKNNLINPFLLYKIHGILDMGKIGK